MPELSRFYGIIIRMYFGDHPPPHFHAIYGEYEALVSIEELSVVAGSYAARDGDDREFPWGNELPSANRANHSASGLERTAPVGSYQPTSAGLHDMAGNV